MAVTVQPDPRLAQFTSVNSVMTNRGLRHAIHLERLKAGQVDKITRFLSKEVMPDLLGQIETRMTGVQRATTAKRITRLKAMSNSVSGLIKGGMSNVNKTLRKDLTAMGFTESSWQLGAIKDSMPIQIGMTAPNIATLQSIVTTRPMRGRLLKSWLNELGTNASNEVMRQINIGLVQGEAIPTIVSRVRGSAAASFKDGIAAKVIRDAQILTRTAVNNVVTQAREITYAANENVVKGVRYLATLDARTTEICAGLDGKVFPINEGERPPMHLQCRSTTVPILKSFKELGIPAKNLPLGTRASMNGQVPATMTYPKWLKKMDSSPKTRAIVDEALGKGKAALWRRGRVPIEKFTDAKHRILTLKQLEKIEARTIARGKALATPPVSSALVNRGFDASSPIGQAAQFAPVPPPPAPLKFPREVDLLQPFNIGGKKTTSDRVADIINRNSDGHLDIREVKKRLRKESEFFVSKRVDIKDLHGFEDLDVDFTLANPNKGRIVVGRNGVIYDGRHRVAFAKHGGQTTIEAWVPIQKPFSGPVPTAQRSSLPTFGRRTTSRFTSRKFQVTDGEDITVFTVKADRLTVPQRKLIRDRNLGLKFTTKQITDVFPKTSRWGTTPPPTVVPVVKLTPIIKPVVPVIKPIVKPVVPVVKPVAPAKLSTRVFPTASGDVTVYTVKGQRLTTIQRNLIRDKNLGLKVDKELLIKHFPVKPGVALPPIPVAPVVKPVVKPVAPVAPVAKPGFVAPVDRIPGFTEGELQAMLSLGKQDKKYVLAFLEGRTIGASGRLGGKMGERIRHIQSTLLGKRAETQLIDLTGDAREALIKAMRPERLDVSGLSTSTMNGPQLRQTIINAIDDIDEKARRKMDDASALLKDIERVQGAKGKGGLASEFDDRYDDYLELLRDHRAILRSKRNAAGRMFEVPDPIEFSVLEGGIDITLQPKVQEGLDWFQKSVSQKLFPESKGHHSFRVNRAQPSLDENGVLQPARAYAKRAHQGDPDRIYLELNATQGTTIHEAGHTLEYSGHRAYRKMQDFLESRTQHLGPSRRLRDITSFKYDATEYAWKDKFIDAYMGKDYPHASTEILSMGIEYLYMDPLKLATKDPEFFDLIVNLIRGID